MGEVYRAEDSRLGREVAIKVLGESFVADRERLARFEREARVLASLNHTNIGHIYGLEESGDIKALVLELVEGPTLADRIAQGPMPIAETLDVAVQIVEALRFAHEKGIVHRDLKPANVKITPDGIVKVLDFGLAKALEPERSSDPASIDLTQSPTLTSPATELGMILGTAPYMAPEQIEGKEVDTRADLFAFGCVLYEMITGRRAFAGRSVADTLSRVLRDEPVPARELVPALPAQLEWLLAKCLAKDPADRYQGASDLAVDLRAAKSAPADELRPQTPPAPKRRSGLVTAFATGAAILLLGTGLFLGRALAPDRSPPTRRFEVLTLDRQPMAAGGGRLLAISPDGRRLAYIDRGRLFARDLESGETTPVPGSEDGITPFFSPDGEWLIFSKNRAFRKVWLEGGESFQVCDVMTSGSASGAWADDDTIILSDGQTLWKTSAGGGECHPFGEKQRDLSHAYRDPRFLPGGKHLLVELVASGDGGESKRSVALLSRSSGELVEILVSEAGSPRYLDSGQLVFARGQALFAQPFDPRRGHRSGEPRPVLEGLAVNNFAEMDLSQGGTLVYVPSRFTPELELVWVDRDGREQPLGAKPASYWTPRLSPSGRRLAVAVRWPGRVDIHLVDAELGTLEEFEKSAIWPTWTDGGETLAFVSDREPPPSLWRKRVRGGGRAERIAPPNDFGQYVLAASMEPKVFTFYEARPGSLRDISIMRPGEQPILFVATPGEDRAPKLSADARYLAYATDTSGRSEIYVRTCPPCRPDLELDDRTWRISRNGGKAPVWSPDQREILFLAGRKMMSARVFTDPVFRAEPPEPLFETDHQTDAFGNANYDVAPDGRLIMIRAGGDDASRHRMHVVLNWGAELAERVSPDR